ncbi:hypothetical protein ACIPYV_21235, partial [Paenarthrobacter nicotinovorans]|uniref:hypothetical protein n=1 Tax=Paenarthrobacter nicotinovorans TaxID=29320 RepID=UPI00381F977A
RTVALSEALKTPPTRATKTAMDVWLESLTNEDQAIVTAALRNPDWRHTDLLAALVAEGAPSISDTTFGAWRRRVAR